MKNLSEILPRGQAPALVPPHWPAMLAASRDLRNLVAIARACGPITPDRGKAWNAIRDRLSDVVGWFATDRRLDSSRHWDVAKRELRRLFDAGGRP